MSLLRRVFAYGGLGALVSFCAQAAHIACYFLSADAAQVLFLPSFYTAYWPSSLRYYLFERSRAGSAGPGNLALAGLLSFAAWIVLGALVAVIQHCRLRHRFHLNLPPTA